MQLVNRPRPSSQTCSDRRSRIHTALQSVPCIHLHTFRIEIALETALRNLNKDQGLGIVVAGMLFDTNFVKKLVFFIVSTCTTIVPVLLFNGNQSRSALPDQNHTDVRS